MRLPYLIAFLIILVSGLFTVAATARIQNDSRQEIQPMTFLKVREHQEFAGTTTTGDMPKQTTTTKATTTGNAHSSSTATAETTPSTTTAALDATSTPRNGTKHESSEAEEIPLEPSLTPAMGVAGFILIALGAVLALIGSRNLWVQVFLSTGSLASIGVTVLITYVMSPPATNAVQGAYIVAVFFTGLTFGALAIFFKELAEGLGCLLGGFCFSMWLMTLKPGGLLTETGSKSGFIAAITAVGFALSFSQYTRTYGLIVSTAFSGGTALVLGVDCFSRAGLKEFWLYIWDLNDKTFPGDTSTYPISRNIRVELAVTVIVTLLGVVSQLRLWEMIRQRRRSDAKEHDDKKRKSYDADLEAARQFEENNIRQRAEWEARYGGDNTSHAQNREISKATSIQELPVDEHEIHEKAAGPASTENVTDVSTSGHSQRCEDCKMREANGEALYIASETASQTPNENAQNCHDIEPEVTADQTPPPLFNGVTAVSMDHGDNQSIASAVIGSEMDPTVYSRTPIEQQSWTQAQKTFLCDESSGSSISFDREHGDGISVTERDITEQVPKMENSPKEQDPDETQGLDLEDVQDPEHGCIPESQKETGSSSKTKTEPNPKRASLNEDTVKDLPQRASRIVQSYRTNEWAKHLDNAEIPEPPPIQPIEEDQPQIPVEATGKQPVAPVIVNELLQTPLNAQPPPAIERNKQHDPQSVPRESRELQSKQTDTAPLPSPLPLQTPPTLKHHHDNGPQRPKRKSPPSLLAVREDLVRYKPSSTCVSIDPWLQFRNNPRNLNTTSATRPTTRAAIAGDEAADDLPLSQRRAMLQTQSLPPPPPPGINSDISRSLTNPDDARDTNAQAIMAAWRNSVREDLRGRQNPLGSSESNTSTSSFPAERASSSSSSVLPTSSPFAFGQSPRDRTSAMTLHIENKIATAIQKGNMHDLHREAIRRLQASAMRRA